MWECLLQQISYSELCCINTHRWTDAHMLLKGGMYIMTLFISMPLRICISNWFDDVYTASQWFAKLDEEILVMLQVVKHSPLHAM